MSSAVLETGGVSGVVEVVVSAVASDLSVLFIRGVELGVLVLAVQGASGVERIGVHVALEVTSVVDLDSELVGVAVDTSVFNLPLIRDKGSVTVDGAGSIEGIRMVVTVLDACSVSGNIVVVLSAVAAEICQLGGGQGLNVSVGAVEGAALIKGVGVSDAILGTGFVSVVVIVIGIAIDAVVLDLPLVRDMRGSAVLLTILIEGERVCGTVLRAGGVDGVLVTVLGAVASMSQLLVSGLLSLEDGVGAVQGAGALDGLVKGEGMVQAVLGASDVSRLRNVVHIAVAAQVEVGHMGVLALKVTSGVIREGVVLAVDIAEVVSGLSIDVLVTLDAADIVELLVSQVSKGGVIAILVAPGVEGPGSVGALGRALVVDLVGRILGGVLPPAALLSLGLQVAVDLAGVVDSGDPLSV
jgi:hypothetical protein